MSVTTWKTTSPGFLVKLKSFLLCGANKPVVEGVPNPELDAGMGKGRTAHELVEEYQMKQKASFGDGVSVKSLLNDENTNKNNRSALVKEARLLKERDEQKGKKAVKKRLERIRSESDEEDDKWLTAPFQEENDKAKAKERGNKASPLDADAEEDEVLNKLEVEEEDEDEQVATESHAKKDNGGSKKSGPANSGKARIVKLKDLGNEDSETSEDFGGLNIPTHKKSNASASSSVDSDAEYQKFMKSLTAGKH